MTHMLPLVGREELLRRVGESLRHALDGGRVMVAIAGERGSGRSRALREIASLPTLTSSMIVDVRISDHDDDALVALDRALRETISRRRGIDVMRTRDDANRTTTSTIELLRSNGVLIPLVITVDNIDAHSASAAALIALLSDAGVPWLLVATMDDRRTSSSTIVGRTTDAIITELRCERLDHEGIGALLRALTGDEPDAGDVAWLVEHTRGLPVLLREALEAATRTGAYVPERGRVRRASSIVEAASEYDLLAPLTVPELARLDASTLDALSTIALLGQSVSQSSLSYIGVDTKQTAALERENLVDVHDETVVFASALVHEAALAHARATRLHVSNADALASLVPSAILAASLRPPSITIEAIVAHATDMAARRALLASLLDAAEGLALKSEYRCAATIMRECYARAVAITDDAERIGRWFDRYASVLYALGHTSELQRLVAEYLERVADDAHDPSVAATVARAMVWSAEFHEREKMIGPALADLDCAEEVAARVADASVASTLRFRARLGRARVFNVADRRDDTLAMLRTVLDGVDDQTQMPLAFDALLIFSRTARLEKDRQEAERRLAHLLARCEHDGLERAAIQLRAARIGMFIGADDFDRFEAEARGLIEQTRHWSLPRTESNAWVWLAIMQAERGEVEEAVLAIDRAIEIRARVRSLALWQIAMITRAQILALAHRDAEATATIEHIERDAKLYSRPCRRFLLDLTGALIAIRAGEWRGDDATIAALRATGESEGFDDVEGSMLEVEGEMLLHNPSIDLVSARAYARRVLEQNPQRNGPMRQNITALAIVARASDEGAPARSKYDGIVEQLRERARQTLAAWIARGAPRNVVAALSLLRAHAPIALSREDIGALDTRFAHNAGGQSWHHCDVETFGSIRVTDAAGTERGGRHFGQHKTDSKPKKMLAALTVAAIRGKRLKRERLIDMVWGESVAPETAVNNFHVTLSGLRQVVGDVVDFDGTSYTLNTRLARVDAIRAVELIDRAAEYHRAGLLFRAYECLRSACALVHGEFLEGIYDDWTDDARDLLRARIRSARVRIAEIALARGETEVAREQISELRDVDALDEDAIYLHLIVLCADGERIRAIREYEQLVERLSSEYGTKPSAQLQSLRASIGSG